MGNGKSRDSAEFFGEIERSERISRAKGDSKKNITKSAVRISCKKKPFKKEGVTIYLFGRITEIFIDSIDLKKYCFSQESLIFRLYKEK
jgi:hypothetical protein